PPAREPTTRRPPHARRLNDANEHNAPSRPENDPADGGAVLRDNIALAEQLYIDHTTEQEG
ncbi:hypothetical protein, partial [Actinomadura alba]|uniref:hypothetical protein n=1 Tax=Actinomadura alba TaxID=406431 RepID=UPI001C9C53E2